MISNLPSDVTDQHIDNLCQGVCGQACTWCLKEAQDDSLEPEDGQATWEITDARNRPFCSNNCRIEQLVSEGHSREDLRRLYEALELLAGVRGGAWYALEKAGIDLVDVGCGDSFKYVCMEEFRNGVQVLLDELGPSDDAPKWLEGGKR